MFWKIIIVIIFGWLIADYNNNVVERRVERQLIQQKEKEKQCLTTALYHEARGEGEFGMKAVANVIHNRYLHPDYPDTYCGVINQRKQFSYTLEGKPQGEHLKAHIAYKPEQARVAYQTAEKIADDVVEGRFQKFLPSNVLWYTTMKVKNYWTKTKKVVAQIGNHKFYSDKEKKK
jgi:spore germination cell wall hydrolase CwlJ-like protein